jgi:hypothetical protein
VRRILAGVVAAGVLLVAVPASAHAPPRLRYEKTTTYAFTEDEVSLPADEPCCDCGGWLTGPILSTRPDFMPEMIRSLEAL